MNKPFRVCLLLVLPLSAEALAKADGPSGFSAKQAVACAEASAAKGKGQ
jgi:hypothetical protein